MIPRQRIPLVSFLLKKIALDYVKAMVKDTIESVAKVSSLIVFVPITEKYIS